MSDNTNQPDFPQAEIKSPSDTRPGPLHVSRLWLLTLVCFIAAIALIWISVGSSGPSIVIQFNEGHGLKAGDVLRHRGIDVGQVTAVKLNQELSGITVNVTLDEASSGLARQGSRFWIVRPQLSLAGASGLETALGAKYIAVAPGEATAENQTQFQGLTAPPPDGYSQEGIELLLRERKSGTASALACR